jgi:serine/threonine protein kinase
VVKRIKPHVLQNARFRQFFDAEVSSMTRFKHPYAVRLYEASLDDPLGPCLVLEYISGVTLEDVLATFKRLPVEHAVRLLCQLCHALLAAHKAGIMHRDLKPANLMVLNFGTKDETLKVMDFGFAGFTAKPFIQLATLTGKGEMFACGTPAYVSPEMIRGDSVDSRADLYSVGVIFYEMLTGRLPFDYPDLNDLLAAHAGVAPPKFARVGVTDVPPGVEMAAQVALSKFPNERQQTARELAEMACRGAGVNYWEDTTPPGYSVNDTMTSDVVECELADIVKSVGPEDQYSLFDQFEAMLPERLAAAKLRGFLDEVGGVPVASEPGLIRVRIDLPAGYTEPGPQPTNRSGLMSWFSTMRRPTVQKGREPIEMDLRMNKIDANRVSVIVSFRPLREFLPDNRKVWQERCEGLYSTLRKFVMAA